MIHTRLRGAVELAGRGRSARSKAAARRKPSASTLKSQRMRVQDGHSQADWSVRGTLSFYKFREHFVGIDGNEKASPSRQQFALLIQNFRHVDVFAALDLDLA